MIDINATSPVPFRLSETMTFGKAIMEVLDGGRIHKLEWEDKEYYGFLDNAVLTIHKPDGKVFVWMVSEGDIVGNDWIVLPRSN